jgi:arylesterase/paraoxonase
LDFGFEIFLSVQNLFENRQLVFMKIIKRISGLVFVLLIGFIVHVLISTGIFRTIEHQFDGEIIKKISLPGAEDIMISPEDSFALISSTNRRGIPPETEEHGGLYYMDLKSGNFNIVPCTDSFPTSFAPHGISMIRKDSSYKVIAINHTLQGHSIEVFNMDGERLRHEKTMTDPSLISPNDLVLVGENRFYFTNDHGYTEGIGRFLEDYGGLSLSNVVYFDGEHFREVAGGIAYANGINYDTKRQLLFVASPRGFLVKVYTINRDGSLGFIEDIPCGTGVDNIDIDKNGDLWIGGHPNLLRFSAYAKGKEKTAPSEIIKISYLGKNDYTIEKIFVDDGSIMSASSVAVPFGDLILAGNVMDDKFLVLKRKN